VAIYKPAAPGANIILRGEDTRPGDIVLPAGRRINAADSGSLAALGVTEVQVTRPPRVAIISTGDELVAPEETPGSGQIRDVNTPMLNAAVSEAGGYPRSLGIIRDEEDSIRQAMQHALGDCDLLLVSGGTSVGEKDAMPRILSEMGRLIVHGLAVKPGKPTLFGEVSDIPVFGLPGNPVAAYYMFYLLVRPLLLGMQGAKSLDRRLTLPLARTVPSNHGREEIVPVLIREEQIHPVASRSGLITTLASTDGFIRIARDLEGLKQGELVEATLFAR
jgi:molybdopterin molybdotransferase